MPLARYAVAVGAFDHFTRDSSTQGQYGKYYHGHIYLKTAQGMIECAVDVNPHKAGKFMAGTGHEIVGPHALTEREPDVVVVMNPIYRDEIAHTLDDLGLHPKLVTV